MNRIYNYFANDYLVHNGAPCTACGAACGASSSPDSGGEEGSGSGSGSG